MPGCMGTAAYGGDGFSRCTCSVNHEAEAERVIAALRNRIQELEQQLEEEKAKKWNVTT
jgi:hypothetical protein